MQSFSRTDDETIAEILSVGVQSTSGPVPRPITNFEDLESHTQNTLMFTCKFVRNIKHFVNQGLYPFLCIFIFMSVVLYQTIVLCNFCVNLTIRKIEQNDGYNFEFINIFNHFNRLTFCFYLIIYEIHLKINYYRISSIFWYLILIATIAIAHLNQSIFNSVFF